MNENRLFFSYCHAEKKRMDEIVPLVETAGVPVWWDEYALKFGLHLGDEIDKGLETSRGAVLFISPEYDRKSNDQENYIYREKEFILKRKEQLGADYFVGVVLWEGASEAAVPPKLKNFKYLNTDKDTSIILQIIQGWGHFEKYNIPEGGRKLLDAVLKVAHKDDGYTHGIIFIQETLGGRFFLLDAERLSSDGRGEVPACYTEGLKALVRAKYVEEEYPESQSYRVTRAGFVYAKTGREPEQLIQTVSDEGREILRQAVTASVDGDITIPHGVTGPQELVVGGSNILPDTKPYTFAWWRGGLKDLEDCGYTEFNGSSEYGVYHKVTHKGYIFARQLGFEIE